LAVIGQHEGNSVAEYHRKATDVAGAVRALVVQQAITLGKRKYLPVAAYQAVANAMGCTTSARDVQKVEGGYTAIGEVRRLSDGTVIATGEGFVGMDEEKWAKGPEYARRAMVQTRAIGRACRAAFAFVVPMIDGGLETTPHEEVVGLNLDGKAPPPRPLGVEGLRHAAAPKAAASPSPVAAPVRKLTIQDVEEPPPHGDADAPGGSVEDAVLVPSAQDDASRPPPVTFRYGRGKDKTSRDVSDADLEWYVAGARKSVEDPAKERFLEKNRAELELLTAEQAWRRSNADARECREEQAAAETEVGF
jgi:hypothetical protein